MEKKIGWTKEQEEVIEQMIKESEDIGYVQGRDDLLKEIMNDLKRLVRNLGKSNMINKDEINEIIEKWKKEKN